jgi:hypothetical protein
MDKILLPITEWAKEKKIFFLEGKISESKTSIEIEGLGITEYQTFVEKIMSPVIFYEPEFFKIPSEYEFEEHNEADLYKEFELLGGKLKLYKLFFVKEGCMYIYKIPGNLLEKWQKLYDKWLSFKEDKDFVQSFKRGVYDKENDDLESKIFSIAKEIVKNNFFSFQDYMNFSIDDYYNLYKKCYEEDILSLDNYVNKNILSMTLSNKLYHHIRSIYKNTRYDNDEKEILNKIKEFKSQNMTKVEISSRLNLKRERLNMFYYRV